MYIGLHVEQTLFFFDFNETNVLRIFEKFSNTKFHGNLSSGIRVLQCKQKDGNDEATSCLS